MHKEDYAQLNLQHTGQVNIVIASPGQMLGRPKGVHDHQEFIIFNEFQAYPVYF